jgi:methionyl-tRNA formyltransferase
MLRVVFFGTPQIAAELLQELMDQNICEIAGVVTRPDRPKGRSKELIASPVKQLAISRQLPLLQVSRCHQPEALAWFQQCNPDLFLVVAFGEILRAEVLAFPPKGCWNIHASLLPQYRGAAPMQWALRNGDATTGVCIQKMVLACDAGDVALESRVQIPESMNLAELQEALIQAAKPLLKEFFAQLTAGTLSLQQQDESFVSWAPKIELEDCGIDWEAPARDIHNLIRSCDPEPGAYTWSSSAEGGKRLRVLKSRLPADLDASLKPGQCALLQHRLVVGTGQGLLEILQLQPEGKKAMSARDFLNGARGILPTFSVTENPKKR